MIECFLIREEALWELQVTNRYAVGSKMAEILVSDYTLNSLFYWVHRSGFLTFRIGPETPRLGSLLKTTCSDDEEEGGIEDHGVEVIRTFGGNVNYLNIFSWMRRALELFVLNDKMRRAAAWLIWVFA